MAAADSKQKRFEIVYKNGMTEQLRVLRDSRTGVCYLMYGGAITPLIDRDGRPVSRFDRPEGRFTYALKQGSLELYRVIVDRETGVNYLAFAAGYQCSLIPLIDAEGRPLTAGNYGNEDF